MRTLKTLVVGTAWVLSASAVAAAEPVFANSLGAVALDFPDVCKAKAVSSGPVPIPYPNIALSSDCSKGSKRVKITTVAGRKGIAAKGVKYRVTSHLEDMDSSRPVRFSFPLWTFDAKLNGKGVRSTVRSLSDEACQAIRSAISQGLASDSSLVVVTTWTGLNAKTLDQLTVVSELTDP